MLLPFIMLKYSKFCLIMLSTRSTTLAKKIETIVRTWRRRVIYRACTRLGLACVAVSIFLARVVHISPSAQQARTSACFAEIHI